MKIDLRVKILIGILGGLVALAAVFFMGPPL